MPPAAIASSVVVIISRVSGAPVRTSSRHRKSIVIACGNFGARPKPPHCGSNCGATLRDGGREDLGVERRAGARCAQHVLVDRLGELVGLFLDVVALLVPGLGDDLAHPRERRHAVAVLVGEVGAAVERAAVGGEPHRHRPAAAAGERLHGLHVDRVDVGSFFAVDLHVHEQPVHDVGDRGILERLVRHHVTPVARRVADRQEDRLAFGARPLERFVAPRVPVDRVVAVLVEVRAGLGAEAVGHVRGRVGAASAVAFAQR